MLFDTPVFFVFLVLVVSAYWLLKGRQQNALLLVASYFFYGWWDWRFLLLMAGSTTVDYVVARMIAASDNAAKRRSLLTLSIVLNFGFLGFFKYFNFFTGSLASALEMLGIGHSTIHALQIILPPGISFYTFQEVAYIVDVYYKKLEPADSLLDYAVFISLFPHLIAGPIQRPSHLLPQVQKKRVFRASAFFDGCMLILSGLFRKCVIADQCALVANAAFEGRLGHSLMATVLGVYAFAWQIYGDFSGYSDIARGAAQLMGFHFMVNFRQPYLATSLQDFWRRWHISLSSWLRDYLYISLGGNRHGQLMTYRNLLTTMLLGGLWHGANWTFVVWGGIHGAWLGFERLIGLKPEVERDGSLRSSVMVWACRAMIFVVVGFTWIFFRAASLHEAVQLIADCARWEWRPSFVTASLFVAAFSLLMLMMDLRLENAGEEYAFQHATEPRRIAAAVSTAAAIVVFSASKANAFIYFQF